jgi:hypothetical protein
MKYTFSTIVATAAIFLAANTFAQEKTTIKTEVTTIDTTGSKKIKRNTITISNDGIYLGSNDSTWKKKKAAKRFFSTLSVNLGYNFLQDNTNYNDPAVVSYLSNVPGAKKNAQLFNLNQAKSVNFNLYWLRAFKAIDHKAQKLTISSGLGLQIYNFRYDNNITYTRTPSITQDSIPFSKNKLAIDYLNVPLTFTFKTRIHLSESGKKSTWLVYGAGITAGYRISSWTKQRSDARGKVKMHDDFGLNDFNSCFTAEIGIDDVIRFYGSYQLTSMYKNGIDQHPISIGVKLIGI